MYIEMCLTLFFFAVGMETMLSTCRENKYRSNFQSIKDDASLNLSFVPELF
jgi:hypothetical protein